MEIKLCKDCKWCRPTLVPISTPAMPPYPQIQWASANHTWPQYTNTFSNAICAHPKARISPVTGEPDSLCSWQRDLNPGTNETFECGRCSMAGNWWEPKVDDYKTIFPAGSCP